MQTKSKDKMMMSFDLELWHEGEWMKPYLPANAQTNDCFREAIFPILELLSKHRAKATFFATGMVLQKYPDVIRQISEQGHEIACHSFKHRRLDKMNPDEFKQDIIKAKTLIQNITGRAPAGFRAPHFSISEKTKWALPILKETGFQYDSSILLSKVSHSPIKEVGLAVFNFLGIKIPVAGGVYFRFLPFWLYKFLLKRVKDKETKVLYFHQHELYAKTPQIQKGPYLKSKIKYWRVRKSFKKFEKLFHYFQFDSIENVLKI